MSIAHLAAEPASIFYIATGAIGVIIAHFRSPGQRSISSVAMLFCRRSSHEKMRSISLT